MTRIELARLEQDRIGVDLWIDDAGAVAAIEAWNLTGRDVDVTMDDGAAPRSSTVPALTDPAVRIDLAAALPLDGLRISVGQV